MKFYVGDHGFIQPIIILKDDGTGPESLEDKTVQLLLIDLNGGEEKVLSSPNVEVTDPGEGEVDFQPQDDTVLDVATSYKLRAKITDSNGVSYQRHTEPGFLNVEDPDT